MSCLNKIAKQTYVEMHVLLRILLQSSLFCQNLFDWLHKFVRIQTKVSLLFVEGKSSFSLTENIWCLDNKITLSFMCLLVINSSAYKKGKTRNCQKQKHYHWLESTSWKYFGTKNQMKWTRTKNYIIIFLEKVCARNIVDTFLDEHLHN